MEEKPFRLVLSNLDALQEFSAMTTLVVEFWEFKPSNLESASLGKADMFNFRCYLELSDCSKLMKGVREIFIPVLL